MSENVPGVRTSEVRQVDGTFAKGKSGNPSGMSKEAKLFRELLKGLKPQTVSVARKALDRAENTAALDAIINDGEASPEARLEAEGQLNARMKLGVQMIGEIWKYSVPKPQSRVKVSGQLKNSMGELSTEELQSIIRAAKQGGDKSNG